VKALCCGADYVRKAVQALKGYVVEVVLSTI
jgi:hypothetical protein